MPRSSARCSICSSAHRWAVENEYLANGSKPAIEICKSVGISQSAFYRHIKGHLQLTVARPPDNPSAIEWARAATNLIAAVEQYRIIADPAKVHDIAVLTGNDDQGQFVELAIIYSGDAIDMQAIHSMAFDLDIEIAEVDVVSGINPTKRVSAILHAPEIFVGRRKRQA